MSSQNQNIINDSKLKLLSANQRNQRNGKLKYSLQSLERSLSEDTALMNAECNFILQQMQDLKHQISEAINQISNSKISGIMEKAKIDSYFDIMNGFKQGFDVMFAKERKITELHNKELEEMQAVEEEMERQKMAKAQEANELMAKEAAAIEDECDAIERECRVLAKRNKAKMIKLRRLRLFVEAQDKKLELMKKN